MGELGKYALEHKWLKTTIEGYDSNGNAIVERRNKKLNHAGHEDIAPTSHWG